ncbi:MAG: hydrogenase nickel incorporation protein HypB [Zoogloea sp.]|nr:hydrogenase nickel incorporation protein HypB [Zoogloea sp.]
MCNVCGCGSGETRIEGEGAKPAYRWAPVGRRQATRAQAEAAPPASAHAAGGEAGEGSLHFGHGPAGAHAPGMSQAQMVKIEQDILAKNDGFAADNRRWLAERGVLALNLVSSPGSGKTSLLVRTIAALQSLPQPVPVSVVEGDQQTSFDAERIRATGAPALQINTGKGCHLDARMVGIAMERLAPPEGGVLLVENVGNLVCPAAFDLGEAAKVVVLSVTEGEDKPLKYPDMFAAASLMLVNKVDLLPHLNFDVNKTIEFALRVNPRLQVISLSASTGEGFEAWLDWLLTRRKAARIARAERLAGLRDAAADPVAEADLEPAANGGRAG